MIQGFKGLTRTSPYHKQNFTTMAKLKKLPKRPKQSASLEAWKKWEGKCNEVKKMNDSILKAEAEKKKIQSKDFKATSKKK